MRPFRSSSRSAGRTRGGRTPSRNRVPSRLMVEPSTLRHGIGWKTRTPRFNPRSKSCWVNCSSPVEPSSSIRYPKWPSTRKMSIGFFRGSRRSSRKICLRATRIGRSATWRRGGRCSAAASLPMRPHCCCRSGRRGTSNRSPSRWSRSPRTDSPPARRGCA